MSSLSRPHLEARPFLQTEDLRHWNERSEQCPKGVAAYETCDLKLDVALVLIGSSESEIEEIYPPFATHHWAAIARDRDTLATLAVYEFYAAPADPFNDAIDGRQLLGKGIAVSEAAAGKGIGSGLLKALYGAEILVVPNELRTELGSRLIGGLERCGIEVPKPGAITLDWPRQAGVD